MRRLAFAILGLLLAVQGQAQSIVPAPPQVAAEAYILIDAATGFVIARGNPDQPLPPASLTKLMTSYVLANEIAEGRLTREERTVVSENAWSQNPVFNGSSLMWIEPGKDVTIGELERGIVIASGNDATVAVAEHIAGSEDAFAELMNQHAERLGLSNSHFTNSHGLPDPNHYTTARDLARLSAAIISNFPEHYSRYQELDYTYNDIRQYNRNKLLREDPSVDGLKTGYTSEAGYGLVASALRGDMRLISVVLGTSSPTARKNETRSLLNYGFRFYETAHLLDASEELDKPRIWKGRADYVSVGVLEEIVLTLPRGKRQQVERRVALVDDIVAPLAVGDSVGDLTLLLDGELIYQGPVVALEAIEPGGFFARLWDILLMWLSRLFGA
ncbi:D-alanyl-D-alanine carboxypeptidase family protein [Pseudohaliea rubra]|uniref:serine-type D-Ala-D-Ala carboxypeptidase n=1 Tax=Pseudohaliea rubra DSM 19751 TaxID=1265313 RepID=A0A095VN89_9GAMM|nr:D-alanyl-D-alanine carboxypeptidase family protein [Pseudohaliea rubra]KGE02563.1 D-alanyl-D-alanine carboxypeptidase [Pseudohaliea rubra DSM 19751]